jgi:hypothetical protein
MRRPSYRQTVYVRAQTGTAAAARNLPGASAFGAMALTPSGTARAGRRANAALDCACLHEGRATQPLPAGRGQTQNFDKEE